jgi:orotate phosphoribosyltransferase
MALIQPEIASDASPREILRACDGFYECPKDAAGRRLGPMVGYAARDETGRQYVGDVYANFAKIEQWPAILGEYVALPLLDQINDLIEGNRVVYCGAPEGGKALAQELARLDQCRYVYPDRIVTRLKTDTSREETELRMKRHDIYPGDEVVLVEDVCNNFSTTAKLVAEIEAHGGQIQAIACFLNRSLSNPHFFVRDARDSEAPRIPIIALWPEPMTEYKQSEPRIELDLKKGNVIFDPKKEWGRLQAAMREHPA